MKPIVTKNSTELAEVIGLSAAVAAQWVFKRNLILEIQAKAKKAGLTHAELAKKVGCPRTRITALLNNHTDKMSIDFLIKVLGGLGYEINPKPVKIRDLALS